MCRVLLLAWLICWGAPAAAETTVPIDVHSAYLHVDPSDAANGAVPISLASLGLLPGYTIGLECAGDWDAGPGGDDQTNLLGVFSGNGTLLASSLLHRVPGAIDAGVDNFSGGTYPNGQPTDIAEDFLIGRPGITIVIPAGATHLFVTPADIYYVDNSDPDGDLGVKITLISNTSVPGGGPAAPRLALSAQPNPFVADATLEFRLASAGAVRLTIHDLNGRLVQTVFAGSAGPGSHLARWDGRDASGRRVAAGSYFARLEGAGDAVTARMILLR